MQQSVKKLLGDQRSLVLQRHLESTDTGSIYDLETASSSLKYLLEQVVEQQRNRLAALLRTSAGDYDVGDVQALVWVARLQALNPVTSISEFQCEDPSSTL